MKIFVFAVLVALTIILIATKDVKATTASSASGGGSSGGSSGGGSSGGSSGGGGSSGSGTSGGSGSGGNGANSVQLSYEFLILLFSAGYVLIKMRT